MIECIVKQLKNTHTQVRNVSFSASFTYVLNDPLFTEGYADDIRGVLRTLLNMFFSKIVSA